MYQPIALTMLIHLLLTAEPRLREDGIKECRIYQGKQRIGETALFDKYKKAKTCIFKTDEKCKRRATSTRTTLAEYIESHAGVDTCTSTNHSRWLTHTRHSISWHDDPHALPSTQFFTRSRRTVQKESRETRLSCHHYRMFFVGSMG